MKILALDLALRETGWVSLDGETLITWGTIKVSRKFSRGQALRALEDGLGEALEIANPERIVVEYPERWARAKEETSTETQEALAQAKGVLLMLAAGRMECASNRTISFHDPIPVEWCDPSIAKSAIARNKQASKEEVRRSLELQGFPVDRMDEHQVDALAVGVAWWLGVGRFEEVQGND